VNGRWVRAAGAESRYGPAALIGRFWAPLNFTVRCAVSHILVLMLSFALTSASGNEVPGQLSSAPQCASPAPLYDGARTSPPGIMVGLRPDVADPETPISILAKKDGFTIA
jgi:hypothetical protein